MWLRCVADYSLKALFNQSESYQKISAWVTVKDYQQLNVILLRKYQSETESLILSPIICL